MCIRHTPTLGCAATAWSAPRYDDPVLEVAAFLAQRRDAALTAGIGLPRIVLDPGIGFGKTAAHNLALLSRQREIVSLGSPVLVGWSRKSTLGQVTGREVAERLPASLAAALMAVERGARIVRVHDVAATVDVLKVWCATIAP
jgi:dihydropteroate synthase